MDSHHKYRGGETIYRENESIEETIRRADENLYKAKETGRNCVVFA